MANKNLFTVRPKMFRAHPFLWLFLVTSLCFFGAEVAIGIENVIGRRIQQGSPLGKLVSGSGQLGLWVTSFVLFAWWVKNHYTRLVVTPTHVRKRTGIISNRSSQLRHGDIKNMQVDQGPVQYVLGTGTLELSSAGQAAEEIIITDIPNPEQVRKSLSRHGGKVLT